VPDPADRFLKARADPVLAVLEGFHPVKHALRFGADILDAISPDPAEVLALAAALAPDVTPALAACLREVGTEEFARSAPAPPPTPILALARRPDIDPAAVVAAPGEAPLVFLERPNHLGNLGAVVRVAAAAGAAGVLTTGDRDPWHPTALRGSAGLHFALPVARVEALAPAGRPVVAVDPGGRPAGEAAIPGRAILAFGGERHGLSHGLLARADLRVGIPMRAGVSSLNLATAVAILLYAWGGPHHD
jgi:TrmH family RNA methyltransferase